VGDEWTASVVLRGWGAYNYFGAGVIVFRLLVNDGVHFFGRFKHANKMRLVAAALSIVMHVVAPLTSIRLDSSLGPKNRASRQSAGVADVSHASQ